MSRFAARRTPLLAVDLDAIAANWRLLSARHARNHCAAVVKADAYGLGMTPVAARLAEEGCSTFFVATLEEGIALRDALPKPEIYVFGSLLKGEEKEFLQYRLSPVLNTLEQLIRSSGHPAIRSSSALHIDTGMCRLGLNPSEAAQAAGAPVRLLMTHLACASTPPHPLNSRQVQIFEEARRYFPGVPCSMANSAGLFLGQEYHYDLGRPGCALYGITPNADLPNPMHQVAELFAPILQIRTADRDQTVGYGATAEVKRGQRVVTLGLGYADGLHRMAGDSEIKAFLGEYALPLLGRVSMDLTCWDASQVPESALEEATHLALITPRQPVDKVAELCHTIGYEIFTRIGNRVRREYV
jgi:alanine racemase